jgi:CheY-like chemotaxis protein
MEQVETANQPTIGSCLIVEDSEFDSMRMARVLSKSLGEVPVKVATTLDTARTMLREGPLDLILLDNNLPDGLGANFALELAQNKELAHIPVIIVSDWPSPFMWDKAASAGCCMWSTKWNLTDTTSMQR